MTRINARCVLSPMVTSHSNSPSSDKMLPDVVFAFTVEADSAGLPSFFQLSLLITVMSEAVSSCSRMSVPDRPTETNLRRCCTLHTSTTTTLVETPFFFFLLPGLRYFALSQ